MSTSWTPILQDKEHKEEVARFKQIAHNVLGYFDSGTIGNEQEGEARDCSVSSGMAGHALFFCYWYFLTEEKTALERCNAALMQVASALGSGSWSTSLYGGLTGIGWVIDHICTTLGHEKVEAAGELGELCEQIDDYLLQWLQKYQEPYDYDLIGGHVGIGVYCLARLPRPQAHDALELIIRRLAEQSTTDADGICWFTPAAVLHPTQAREFPSGYYNLGLAHGIPGIIAFLSRAHMAGILPAETGRLLRGAVAWMLSRKLAEHEISTFGTVIAAHNEPSTARLAWCYGDAGAAASLLAAGSALQDDAIRAEALHIARKAAARTLENSGVVDASFCHGAFGNAHVFNRLFQATRDPELLKAALYWLRNGAEMQKPDGEMCGYLFYDMGRNGQMSWMPGPGLLMGIAGVGLVTAAALSSRAPDWDEFFLLDIVEQAAAQVSE